VTSRQRIVLLAIAAVVLVAGIAIASSSGGEDGGSDDGTTVATPQTTGDTGSTGGTETAEEPAPPPKPKPRVETIEIRGGGPAGDARTVRFKSGDTIRLRFESDAAGEVHIHGYDHEFPVTAGAPKTIRFKADLEGIFEIEEHGTGELLAKLEVRPA
jgi:hypothetical protein